LKLILLVNYEGVAKSFQYILLQTYKIEQKKKKEVERIRDEAIVREAVIISSGAVKQLLSKLEGTTKRR